MKIVVGNLSFKTTKAELTSLLAKHGEVSNIRLAALVTMPDSGEAANAMKALASQPFKGRNLTVREVRRSKAAK